MRHLVICAAGATAMSLALTLLMPLGWARGLPATEMDRASGAIGPVAAGGPVDTPPQRSDGGLLYLTSLVTPNSTFVVYDPATNSWTTLNGYETGCQMAVGIGGELYAYLYSPPQIEVYDPGSDTWSYVMAAPPGTTGMYCNLEVTRDGEFLYTESFGTAVHYTQGGTWHTFSVPFTTNVMGDYDPAAHQYVIGELYTLNAHLIDLTTWTITDFVGALSNGEYARFSSVMDGRYYCQADGSIYSYNLSTPSEPPQDHGYPGYYPSSAADRASHVIYVASLDGSQLQLFDPAAGTMTSLAPSGIFINISSLAFAAPWEATMPFSDGFESGNTSAWSATVP
jgi:hypothetical protein